MRINVPLKEIENQVQKEIKIQLQELNTPGTELNIVLNNIKNLVKNLESSSQSKNTDFRLKWYQNQINFIGDFKYTKLKIPRKNNQTRKNLNLLHLEILKFTSLFMKRPQTNYVLYYEDGAEIKRAEIPSNLPDNKLQEIFSEKKNRSIQISKKSKDLINKEKLDLLVTQHFQQYAIDTENVISKKLTDSQLEHNKGHIAESFERHFQKKHTNGLINSISDWTKDELITNYINSKGNVAWWRSGDVGKSQVKFFGSSKNVSIGSFNSIQELANYILWLGEIQYDDLDLNDLSNSIAKAFVDSRAVDNYAGDTIDKLLDKWLKAKKSLTN